MNEVVGVIIFMYSLEGDLGATYGIYDCIYERCFVVLEWSARAQMCSTTRSFVSTSQKLLATSDHLTGPLINLNKLRVE
jgi:hypothetical protein